MDQETRRLYSDALALYEAGKINESIEVLKQVVRNYPQYPDVHNALGLVYSLAGNHVEAVKYFKKATELNPRYIEAFVNLAIVYNEQCQFEDAIRSFERAATLETLEKGFSPKLKAELAQTYRQLGDTYYELQDYENAREEYEKATRLAPTFPDMKLKLAKAYLQLERYQDTETLLLDILAQNANYLEAKTTLGLCFYRQQRFAEAKKEWQQVLVMDPQSIKARSYLHMLRERHNG
ncbi:tetratricopeptide repeat protein [candidate division WOR-3 bacterium]|nr:tetratricopeptide repeat protein [candidate division WOR-3 bacterium]